jgi:hypothetical protein
LRRNLADEMFKCLFAYWGAIPSYLVAL